MARIGTTSKAKLKDRYPEGCFNPHTDNVGIMANYHVQGTSRRNDSIPLPGRVIGRGRGKAKIVNN